MIDGIAVRPRHDVSAVDIGELEERLYRFNVEATGYDDGEGLGFVAEDRGELIGAVAGYSWGGICELRQVWVHADRRRRGLGAALLAAAVAEAARRGCAHVTLTTYDFQAPDFYRRYGFEEIAQIPDKPLGHTELVMRRSCA
ncbi:MAG TPA: GNAT family N-acetyltransferase [Caulobacteraceae bacterium]